MIPTYCLIYIEWYYLTSAELVKAKTMNNPLNDKLTGAHKTASDPDYNTQQPPSQPPKKKRKSKSPEERLAELQKKQNQIAERVKAQQAKIKTDDRKKDTRRKIVTGAIALEHMEHDENFRHVMEGLLKKDVKETDLHLFEFE